ncbi:hypothetical protein BD626DRAFT_103880 [Schizophyllum amplum]|uniref:Uncharacterized protein n=1 Tax=Schizophyllum amplum TaxID=97359 RepID=A0A550CS68_9AGAR|nr:hypothetical protein BD626DRAFT_103880 [Auriculariopsis ampla]
MRRSAGGPSFPTPSSLFRLQASCPTPIQTSCPTLPSCPTPIQTSCPTPIQTSCPTLIQASCPNPYRLPVRLPCRVPVQTPSFPSDSKLPVRLQASCPTPGFLSKPRAAFFSTVLFHSAPPTSCIPRSSSSCVRHIVTRGERRHTERRLPLQTAPTLPVQRVRHGCVATPLQRAPTPAAVQHAPPMHRAAPRQVPMGISRQVLVVSRPMPSSLRCQYFRPALGLLAKTPLRTGLGRVTDGERSMMWSERGRCEIRISTYQKAHRC